jgi:hypothetical protein
MADTDTYDVTTPIGKVRLLVSDNVSPYHFHDSEIQAFLDLYSGVLRFASAMALESWAAALAQTADSERIGDYAYTKKQVQNMLSLAQKYRDEEGTTPVCGWAELDLTTYGDVESADAVNDWQPIQPDLG